LSIGLPPTPDVGVEGAELFLDFEEGLGVGDGGGDFEAVSDDAFVFEELGLVLGGEAGDFGWVKVGEGFAVGGTFLEDGFPGEAGLGAFEDQELEEEAVVVDRDAPL
jgi:hypothetical protein